MRDTQHNFPPRKICFGIDFLPAYEPIRIFIEDGNQQGIECEVHCQKPV